MLYVSIYDTRRSRSSSWMVTRHVSNPLETFAWNSLKKSLRFTTGILRTQKLEGVYTTIVDLVDLSTRVVSFGSMLKRAKSLWHLKTAQKPEKRLRNALARELGRNPRRYTLESS